MGGMAVVVMVSLMEVGGKGRIGCATAAAAASCDGRATSSPPFSSHERICLYIPLLSYLAFSSLSLLCTFSECM